MNKKDKLLNDFINRKNDSDKLKAIDVAHYIINNSLVSNLRLNKLLYYCQYESLKKYNKPLFADDFVAFEYGAVVPDVYYMYCCYGGLNICTVYNDVNISKQSKDLIDDVINRFKDTDTWDLVELNKTGAWKIIYNKDGIYSKIPKELIKNDDVIINSAIGSSWDDFEKEAFTPEEIKASNERVKQLKPKLYILILVKEREVYDSDLNDYMPEYEDIVCGVFDSEEKACEEQNKYSDEFMFYIEECYLNDIIDKAREEIDYA